jgi:hypothetical protein
MMSAVMTPPPPVRRLDRARMVDCLFVSNHQARPVNAELAATVEFDDRPFVARGLSLRRGRQTVPFSFQHGSNVAPTNERMWTRVLGGSASLANVNGDGVVTESA